eukprot:15463073-Alexandrium_andersonii.AAC.1
MKLWYNFNDSGKPGLTLAFAGIVKVQDEKAEIKVRGPYLPIGTVSVFDRNFNMIVMPDPALNNAAAPLSTVAWAVRAVQPEKSTLRVDYIYQDITFPAHYSDDILTEDLQIRA